MEPWRTRPTRAPDTREHTTLDQTLTGPDPHAGPYAELNVSPTGEPYIVRDQAFEENNPAIPTAKAQRAQNRTSMSYFAQMTDFQLADEESPSRVEFADPGAGSAHRPQEALTAFQMEATVLQINEFAGASPVQQGTAPPNNGARAEMDFALLTGDQADNNQRNESIWVREILEGGNPLNFNSGDVADINPQLPGCFAASTISPGLAALTAEAPKYTGVQDYSDYPAGAPNQSLYYDPNQPTGQYAGWPEYEGVLDRAQQIVLNPTGLDNPNTGAARDLPFYVTHGNHDVLVQGNEDANREFEQIATGCMKVLASSAEPGGPPCQNPDPDCLPGPLQLLTNPSAFMLVPPDQDRQFTSKPQLKEIYAQDGEDSAHGLGLVDPAENNASNPASAPDGPLTGSASYYSIPQGPGGSPPGFKFISIDTNSEGGVVEQSSSGNIDDPQFQWLKNELEEAEAADELVVIFGHHPVRSLTTEVPDEAATQCTAPDSHGHDTNPGCDLDPRPSAPIHLGQDPQAGDPRESFVELLDQFPHVIGYVPGHTHEHRVTPFPRSDGTVWWELNTSAVIDWPTQSRLIEVMDNEDGTLSIFGTVLDHASTANPTQRVHDRGLHSGVRHRRPRLDRPQPDLQRPAGR